jgi:hypothetical protein
MKYSFLILALSAFTHVTLAEAPNEYVQAGQVKMSAKDCEELGVKVSIVAFSSDGNSSFSLLGLNNPKATGFFDTTRKQIHERMTAYCKDDKSLKTIDDFENQFQESCEPGCSDNIGKFYKDSILGASTEKKNAELTCLSLCNKTLHNLEFVKTGARFSGKELKPTRSAAADCTGAVSDSGRSKTKEPSWDEVQKNVGSGLNAVYLEKIKASEK